MPEWLALLLLAAAGLVLGWLLAIQFLPWQAHGQGRETFDAICAESGGVPFLFAGLSLGLAAIGWTALALAELGWFSTGRLAALWLVAVLLLAFAGRRRLGRGLRALKPAAEGPAPDRLNVLGDLRLSPCLEAAGLVVWLAAATWLFFRPHEFVMGGADAGVYVNMAAQVADQGNLLIDDPTLAALDPALYPSLLRERQPGEGTPYYLFPGFNVVEEPAGRVIPDFFHLFPVWQAVVYGASGVWATLLMPGLWALLGCLAVYLTVRQAAGWPVAMLALAGLSVNALQVWFARYPVTETLTQYLLWTGLWAFGAWLSGRRPVALWGLLAGLALGQVLLVRIDMIFLLALPVLTAGWLWLRHRAPEKGTGPAGRRQEGVLWFFLPAALLTAHMALHTLFISTPYFARIANYVSVMLKRFWAIPAALAVVAAAGLLLAFLYRRRPQPFWDAWRRYRRALLGTAGLLVLLLTAYGWFVRPVYGAAPSFVDWYSDQRIVLTDRENLRRLGWYLSPLGVWLGAAGIALLLWRVKRVAVAVVGVGLFFSVLYLWRIQATPHQIYAMRRYLPVTLPFFVVGGAYLMGWLAARPRRWMQALALALAIAWLGGMAWSARGFISHVDNRGFISQLEELNNQLGRNSVLVVNDQAPVGMGDLVGTPLHFLYGHDVFTLREPQALDEAALTQQIGAWQSAGRDVYWVGEPTFLEEQGMAYSADAFTFRFTYLENVYDHKPARVLPAQWMLSLAKIRP